MVKTNGDDVSFSFTAQDVQGAIDTLQCLVIEGTKENAKDPTPEGYEAMKNITTALEVVTCFYMINMTEEFEVKMVEKKRIE